MNFLIDSVGHGADEEGNDEDNDNCDCHDESDFEPGGDLGHNNGENKRVLKSNLASSSIFILHSI